MNVHMFLFLYQNLPCILRKALFDLTINTYLIANFDIANHATEASIVEKNVEYDMAYYYRWSVW